jgi:hypothetical protein
MNIPLASIIDMTYLAQPRATKKSQDTGHHLAKHEQSFPWKIRLFSLLIQALAVLESESEVKAKKRGVAQLQLQSAISKHCTAWNHRIINPLQLR